MFNITKHYAQKSIKEAEAHIRNLKRQRKHVKVLEQIIQEVKQNCQAIPKIAKPDRYPFFSYNINKLASHGLSLRYFKYIGEDNLKHVSPPYNFSSESYRRLTVQSIPMNCYNCHLHMGKNGAILTYRSDGRTSQNCGDNIPLVDWKPQPCSARARKATVKDLQDYLYSFSLNYRDYNDSLDMLADKVDYLESHLCQRKINQTRKLNAIRADGIAMELHQEETHRFSKTEHRFTEQDFRYLQKAYADNRTFQQLIKEDGVATIPEAQRVTQNAPHTGDESYTHMISSQRVAKTHHDAQALAKLVRKNIQYVQNDAIYQQSIGEYYANSFQTVKPLQPKEIAKIAEKLDKNIK